MDRGRSLPRPLFQQSSLPSQELGLSYSPTKPGNYTGRTLLERNGHTSSLMTNTTANGSEPNTFTVNSLPASSITGLDNGNRSIDLTSSISESEISIPNSVASTQSTILAPSAEVVSAGSTSPTRVKLEDSGFERTLVQAGFTPISKIHTRRDNDIIEAAFIKVISRDGYTAYVQLDIEGDTLLRESDTIVVQSSTPTSISASIKKGLYECARHQACGVLFACKDGICTLTGQAIPDPQEKVYIVDNQAVDVIIFGQYPIPYPVVLMSVIPLHPETVHGSIRTVSEKLMSTITNHCGTKLGDYDQGIQNLHNIFTRYCHLQTEKYRQLVSNIQNLQQQHDRNISTIRTSKADNADPKLKAMVQSEEFDQKFRLIYSNLVEKRQRLTDLIRICYTITDCKSQMDDIILRIKELGDHVNEKYANIHELQSVDPNTAAGIVSQTEHEYW